MTEQEKLHHAKHYIDSLANGLNPLDGTPIPEQDIVNNVKISRCLFFVSDVLRKQLDGHEPKKVSEKDKKLFYITEEEKLQYYVNEHIVNLLLEVRGNLRTEKQEMLSTIDRFLTLPPDERLLFTVGRRLNIFFRLDDLKKPKLHQKAGESLQQILSKNPHVDFAALCNYVRQSQI